MTMNSSFQHFAFKYINGEEKKRYAHYLVDCYTYGSSQLNLQLHNLVNLFANAEKAATTIKMIMGY